MPLYSNAGAVSLLGTDSTPASVKGIWQQTYSDARTATSAANISNPRNATAGLITWVRVPDNARAIVFACKTPVAGIANVNQQPIVKVIAAWVPDDLSPNTTASLATSSWPTGTRFHRVDNSALSQAGITLTFDTTGDNNSADSTYYYSTLGSVVPTDCLGGWYVAVIATTALGFSSGGAASPIDLAFVN